MTNNSLPNFPQSLNDTFAKSWITYKSLWFTFFSFMLLFHSFKHQIICFLDYRLLVRWGWGFYAVLILALIYVLYSGGSTNTNVARWIVISGLSIQPSEFAKLIIVLMLANYYNDARKFGNSKLSNVLFPIFLVVLWF